MFVYGSFDIAETTAIKQGGSERERERYIYMYKERASTGRGCAWGLRIIWFHVEAATLFSLTSRGVCLAASSRIFRCHVGTAVRDGTKIFDDAASSSNSAS